MICAQMSRAAVPCQRGARCTPLRRSATTTHARLPGSARTSASGAPAVHVQRRSSIVAQAVPATVAAADVDPEYDTLRSASGSIARVGFLAFWSQLALSLSSAAVLIFSIGLTSTNTGTLINVMSLAGVVLAFISTFFALSLRNTAKKLQAGQPVKLGDVLFNLNATNTINLLGIGTAVIGLQAAVGTLVGKTLQTQPQFGMATAGNNLVSLDVFSLQALTNTLMAHFIALIFGSILMRILNKTRA